jgi:hypothetical protein
MPDAPSGRDDALRVAKRQELVSKIVKQLGDTLINDAKGQLEWRSGYVADVITRYEVRRGQAESLLQKPSAHKIALGKIVDRHKVAASLLLAVLDAKPLTRIFRPNESAKDRVITLCFFRNEVLAFKSAIEVMVRWLRSDYRNRQDLVTCLGKSFDYPVASEGAYQEHVYKALHLASGGLDILLLANLMFMLENHNLNAKRLEIFGAKPGLQAWLQ